MMRTFCLIFLCCTTLLANGQAEDKKSLEDIQHFQDELTAEYKNPGKSPLEARDLRRFKKHDFFPVDLQYRVTAVLAVTEETPFFGMPTSTSRLPMYRKYGTVTFSLLGTVFQLPVYQSKDLMKKQEYEDYLFLPFTDLTNGEESYSGGRYLGLRLPKEGDVLIIDFNQAYNPYCAYSARFSCPVVPPENNLNIPVRAGVRYVAKKGKKK